MRKGSRECGREIVAQVAFTCQHRQNWPKTLRLYKLQGTIARSQSWSRSWRWVRVVLCTKKKPENFFVPHTKNRKFFLAGGWKVAQHKCNYLCCEQLLLILLNVATRTQHGLPAPTAAAVAHGTRTRKTNLIKYKNKRQNTEKPLVISVFGLKFLLYFAVLLFMGFFYLLFYFYYNSLSSWTPLPLSDHCERLSLVVAACVYLIYLLCMSWHHNWPTVRQPFCTPLMRLPALCSFA